MELNEALQAVFEEMEYQDQKYGKDRQQSLPGYLLILEKELREAKKGWIKNKTGRDSVMSEVVQVAAVAIRAICKYGSSGCPFSTDDICQSAEYQQSGKARSEEEAL